MGTRAQTIVMTLVYVGLAVCLISLQATALIENFPHQVFGIAFFVLLVCHLVLNRFWIRHSLSGKWDVRRAALMVIDVALMVLSLVQVVNCVLLSSFFWSLLPQQFAFFSSSLHMCIGTWIFVIAAIHFGLNTNALIGNRLHFERTGKGKLRTGTTNVFKLLVWLILAAVGIYGVFEFFQLHMANYMFMIGEGSAEMDVALVIRFGQYLCVGVAFAEISHWLSVLLQRRGQKPHAQR